MPSIFSVLATKMRFGADRVTKAPVPYSSSYYGELAYVAAGTPSLTPVPSNAWASFESISIVAAGCDAVLLIQWIQWRRGPIK